MAGDVVTWRDELDGLIVQYGLMCAFGSSTDMMKAKADIGRHVDSLCSDRGALRDLTDEEIRSIDDSTHFHESPDWSVRFARNVLAAARGVLASEAPSTDEGDGTPEQEAFCNRHCCWSGHHPDCFRATWERNAGVGGRDE